MGVKGGERLMVGSGREGGSWEGGRRGGVCMVMGGREGGMPMRGKEGGSSAPQ